MNGPPVGAQFVDLFSPKFLPLSTFFFFLLGRFNILFSPPRFAPIPCSRDADEELERTEPHVARADGQLGERVQQPRRQFGRDASTTTIAGVVRPAVRDDRQRKTGPGGGPAVAELRLQVPDIRRRLRGQIRSHIHER